MEADMIRGLYTAATAMQTQQNKMDVVTNNLANAETAGYKEDNLLSRSFADLLISSLDDPAVVRASREVGPLNTGVHLDEIYTTFDAGALKETGESTDLALLGDGFFAVQTPDGERYTRSGQFSVDASGTLVTEQGYPVLGENGPIRPGSVDFTISGSGLLQSAQGNEQLRVVSFADKQGLRKAGGNLYSNFSAGEPVAAEAQVRQGYLEASNVDLASQMVNMIDISRNFELNQRVIRIMDERLGHSVSEIGKL